jgi:hypothetical protein
LFHFGSKVCPTFLFWLFDPRGWLAGQGEVELVEQQLEILPGLGVAREDQVAAVGGRQVYVDHLHGLELFENGARRESGHLGLGSLLQGHLQAVAQEADEDVRFDTFIFLVVDGADGEVVLEFLEGLLDFGEDDVLLPQFLGFFGGEVGAEQVGAFAPAGFAQFLPVEAEGEGLGGDGFVFFGYPAVDEPPDVAGLFSGRPDP